MEWIMASVAILVFIIVISIAVAINNKKNKDVISLSEDKKPKGLFQEWEYSFYDLFFANTDERSAAKKVGINASEYIKNCDVADIPCDLKSIVGKMLLGLIVLAGSIVVAFISKVYLIMLVGVIFYFVGAYLPSKRPKKKAAEKRSLLISEMPRFIDMLETAVYINMPVTDAIAITTKYLPDMALSKEFKGTLAEIQIGAYSWQEALKNMAEKYNIDIFSDFVLDIITSYEKGLPMYDSVVRENEEIKKTYKLQMKANAQKLNSTLIFPITIFKLLPLMLIIAIPLVSQLTQL